MLLVPGLLVLAGSCATAGPWLLRDMGWQVAHPARALRTWFVLFVLGLLALAASLIAAVVQAAVVPDTADGIPATVAVVAGWVLLGVLGVAIGLVTHHASPVVEGHRIGQSALLLTVVRDEVDRRRIGGAEVVVVRSDQQFAVAGRDCDADVVISDALARTLRPAELHAVVQHELAHLRERHALLRAAAQIAGALAPRARCGAGFSRTVHLLTELAADDRAVRSCGAEATASALMVLACSGYEPGALLRAQRVLQISSANPALAASASGGSPSTASNY